MIKKPFYFVFFVTAMVLLVQSKSYSQDILWEKSYGGKHAEYLFDVIPTPDYGFILAGSSLSKKTGNKTEDNRGDLDYWVWKMDEKGDLDWQKSVGGSGQDLLKAVVLTNEGGFLLAGSSLPNPSKGGAFTSEEEVDGDYKGTRRGQSDFWIIKLNAKGGEEWQKTIGGSGQDDLTAVVRTRDGGFIVGGSSASQPNPSKGEVVEQVGKKTTPHYGGLDYWVLKLDKDGNIVWQQSFGGKYNDELRSIALTEDGGFLLGGSSNSPESGNKTQKHLGESDYWIIKLDKDGNEQWQKIIGSTGDDQLYAIHTTKDGHYLLAGNSNSEPGNDKRSSNESGTDFWVVKVDKDNKNILWQETYNIAKVDILTSVVENDDSTILLSGYAQGSRLRGNDKFVKGTADYVVIKIDSNGEEKWRKDVGSDGEDILKKVVETRDGGYLMAGTSKSPLTPEGGIKATGDKSSGIGGNDFWVVKLKDRNKKQEAREKIEAIPNPAVDYTNVIVGYEFEKGTATLVDLAGHVLQQFKITERTVPIDLQGLPEGIYIVNIKTDKGNDGVKIIKKRK